MTPYSSTKKRYEVFPPNSSTAPDPSPKKTDGETIKSDHKRLNSYEVREWTPVSSGLAMRYRMDCWNARLSLRKVANTKHTKRNNDMRIIKDDNLIFVEHIQPNTDRI